MGSDAEDQHWDRMSTRTAGTGCWAECDQQLSWIHSAFVAHFLFARPCAGHWGPETSLLILGENQVE